MIFQRAGFFLLVALLCSASAFASACEVSCSFANYAPVRSTSSAAKMNRPLHADHSCCQRSCQGAAIRAPHVAMSPDFALDPSLRPKLQMPGTRSIGIPGANAIQIAAISIVSPLSAETPPQEHSSLASPLVAPALRSVLRI